MNHTINLESTYLALPEVFYTRAAPSPVACPSLVIFNESLGQELGFDFTDLSRADLAVLFSGQSLPEGTQPLALAYAGHQFGHLTMLGDGRAHLIGEKVTPDGRRVDIQLKGSGRTPYSRGGDGRAALGPMLREYLISEAMAALGIPTTRSLAVTETGQEVHRETRLPGAILTRVAASHLRVGTFEFAELHQDPSLIQALLDYTIDRHMPELNESKNKALALLDAVIQRQADLIVHWMRVGFIHGVMNTDNMALSGETIDYGPCAFMDAYDPKTVFSSIDRVGRYAYASQPGIALWNLSRFAQSLLPVIHEDTEKAIELAEASLNGFSTLYRENWLSMMRAKLGLFGCEQADLTLISDLLAWMQKNQADYTNTFLELTRQDEPTGTPDGCDEFKAWQGRWQARRERHAPDVASSRQLMRRVNPCVIPRNHRVEESLDAALAGDIKPLHDLLAALRCPYEDRDELRPYQSPPEADGRNYQTFCGT